MFENILEPLVSILVKLIVPVLIRLILEKWRSRRRK